MSLSNRINVRGGGNSQVNKFPWNAYTDGVWDRKGTGSISGSTVVSMTCATLSPKIVEGCSIVATTSGDSTSFNVTLQVSTDGNSWTTLQTKGGSTTTFGVALTSYVGQRIYIRFNGASSGANPHYTNLTSCVINQS